MSLEKAIQENTATIRELIEVLTRTTLPQVLPAAKPVVSAQEVKALMADPEDVDKDIPDHVAKATKPKKEPKAKAEEAPKAPKIEYAAVADAITEAVAQFQRGPVKALLNKYAGKEGAVGKDLKPEQYAGFLADLKLLAEAEEELA